MEPNQAFTPICEQLKQYLETKQKLLKLEAIDKTSIIAAEMIINLTIAVFFLIAFIVFSLALALLAAHLLHSNWEGLCCITLLYILITMMISLFKVHLKNSLVRKFIEMIFRKKNAEKITYPINSIDQNEKHNEELVATINLFTKTKSAGRQSTTKSTPFNSKYNNKIHE